MYWRSTAWLTGAALALYAFIVFVERPARLARLPSAEAPRLVPRFDPSSVHTLEIRPQGKPVVRLVRTNRLWVLQAPPHPPARQDLAEELVRRIATLRGHSILSPEELRRRPGALDEFGLNPPDVAVALISPSGTTELFLGIRSVQGSHVYLQIAGSAGIFTAEASLADRLPSSANAWRETALVPFERLDFDRVRIESRDAPFTLARDATNGHWNVVEPRLARADSARVGILLRQLGALQIRDFVSPASAPPPESMGFRPPRLVASLVRGTEEIFEVSFGGIVSNTPAVYAQRSHESDILAIEPEPAELFRVSYKDLLDRRILRFDPNQIRELEITGGTPFGVVRRDIGWRLVPGGTSADTELVARLVTGLASLEVLDIAKEIVTDLDLASYGLAPPKGRLSLFTMTGDTNTPGAVLETGTLKDNRLFARVRGDPAVYLLNPADLENVPSAPWQLRDRTLWRFDATNVTSVAIRHGGVEWTVRRQGPDEWTLPPGLQNEINPFALDEALHVVGLARAISWVASGSARHAAFGIGRGPDLALELRGNAPTNLVRIAFGKRSPAGHRYAASTFADGASLVFELPGPDCDDLLRELGIDESPP